MSTLNEKVCIVTGASSGIGAATAVALAARGAKVVIAARRAERLDALAERIRAGGGDALTVTCDVTDREQVQVMIGQTMSAFGRIDVLINNAGIMCLAPLDACRMDDWDDMIDVNIKGLLYGTAFALPIMLKQKTGHIINVSSIAGRRVFPAGAVYCGTKHAVHVISEGLRNELATRGKEDGNTIRVTIIAPGLVATELPDSIRDDATREGFKSFTNDFQAPLVSEDIAAGIVYAAESPEHVNVNEIVIRPTNQVS